MASRREPSRFDTHTYRRGVTRLPKEMEIALKRSEKRQKPNKSVQDAAVMGPRQGTRCPFRLARWARQPREASRKNPELGTGRQATARQVGHRESQPVSTWVFRLQNEAAPTRTVRRFLADNAATGTTES